MSSVGGRSPGAVNVPRPLVKAANETEGARVQRRRSLSNTSNQKLKNGEKNFSNRGRVLHNGDRFNPQHHHRTISTI